MQLHTSGTANYLSNEVPRTRTPRWILCVPRIRLVYLVFVLFVEHISIIKYSNDKTRALCEFAKNTTRSGELVLNSVKNPRER